MTLLLLSKLDMSNETFAQRVRRLRRSNGLSQRELAKAAGVSKTQVYLVERGPEDGGIGMPQPSTLKGYAEALGVSLAELTTGVSPPSVLARIEASDSVAAQLAREYAALERDIEEQQLSGKPLRERLDLIERSNALLGRRLEVAAARLPAGDPGQTELARLARDVETSRRQIHQIRRHYAARHTAEQEEEPEPAEVDLTLDETHKAAYRDREGRRVRPEDVPE